MKTTVFCVTVLFLELASSFPFPEQLPSYYGSYEPVPVPEQRIIPQPIQISNLAHSQSSDLPYQQQQLAYPQQENARRQNYENLLRKQEQQQQVAALKQRLANQLLIPSQSDHKYSSPVAVNTVHDPYINPVSLQHPTQQPQYGAPVTLQYQQNPQINQPYKSAEPQQFNVPNPEPQSVAGPSTDQPNFSYDQKFQPVQNYNAQHALYNPRIQEALASTPLNKRYLVIHPNGTMEHIDKIDDIVQRHPNYILVQAGDLRKLNEVTPTPVNNPPPGTSPLPQPSAGPVVPVAPLTPVVPSKPSSPVVPPSAPEAPPSVQPAPTPAPPDALPPPIPIGTVPGPKPTVQPPTDPTSIPKPVNDPTAFPPYPISLAPPPSVTETATAVHPPKPITTSSLPPTVTIATVTPPSATATPVYALPDETTCTTLAPPVTIDPTAPSGVTATATTVYPPPSEPETPTPTPIEPTADPTVTPAPLVNITATAVYPSVTDLVTSVANVTATSAQSPEARKATKATTAASEDNQLDIVANATVSDQADPTTLDLPFKPPTKPVVWFRTTDLNFWDKLTSGNETYDVVYFFIVPREPRVLKDTKTVIYANGTVVEEETQTIYDDEDSPPRVIKTTKVKNPDEKQPKT